VGAEHWAFDVQVVPVGFGLQPPLTHVKPAGQNTVAQLLSQRPSTQIRLGSPQSLLNLHPFAAGVQTPPTQMSVPLQSVVVVHAHGPAAPPHVWHLPPTHAAPGGQSAPFEHTVPESGGGVLPSAVSPSGLGTHLFATHCLSLGHSALVVHSLGTGPTPPGGTHKFDVQTSPWGQSPETLQVVVQPWSVQTWPLAQLVLPVHGELPGGFTLRHP
jgi:hypothetical protein